MTYLSWDEIRPPVLTLPAFCGLRGIRGRGLETQVCTAHGDYPNEFYQSFSHRHDRADPGRDIGLGWRRAGAIAGAGGKPLGCTGTSRGEQSGDAGARPVSRTSPAPAETPAPVASPSAPPATPPAAAQAPATPPSPAPVQTADPFGEQITLEPKKVVIMKGTANWDSAFDTLMESFKTLTTLLDKQGIKPSGNVDDRLHLDRR